MIILGRGTFLFRPVPCQKWPLPRFVAPRCLRKGPPGGIMEPSERGDDSMLSENIRRFRKARSLRQEELAERVHVVRQTVSKWENGVSLS